MQSFRPKHISHSAIQLYENCGYCYFLQYVMGCWPKEKVEAHLFGSCYHAGLAAYHYGMAKDFWTGFKNEATKLGVTGKTYIKFEVIARPMWENYLTFGDKYEGTKIEYPFETQLQNPVTGEYLKVPIKGVIDLISLNEEIIDHKTSSEEYGEEKLNDPQLHIYSMVYRKLFGRPAKKLIYSVHLKGRRNGKWHKVEIEPDEMQEAIVFTQLKYSLKGIMMGDFVAKPVPYYWFKHQPMCPQFIRRRKKESSVYFFDNS